MLDFERLVESFIVEMGETPVGNQEAAPNEDSLSEQTPAEAEEEMVKSLAEQLKEQYQTIQTKFNTVFKRYYSDVSKTFIDESSFEKLIYVVAKNSLRDTENVGSFENQLGSIFPLIDLIALCKQAVVDTKEVKGENRKQAAVEIVIQSFFSRLDGFAKAKLIMPLEFTPISPWASNVRARYYEKAGRLDVGKIKLENPELQTKSIRELVMFLLEQRRKSKIKLFDREIAIGSAEADIDNILTNPNNYKFGSVSFPDKKINLLYTGATPDLILTVSNNVYNLYTQQVQEKGIPKEDVTPELYQMFLNGGAEQFKAQENASTEDNKDDGQWRLAMGESLKFD